VITDANVADLDRVGRTEGVQIRRPNGFVIQLFFKDDRISGIWRSVPARDTAWFREGEGIDETIVTLRRLCNADPELRITPAVPTDSRLVLGGLTAAQTQRLYAYDAWSFQLFGEADKPNGATIEVYFMQGRLTKIHYRRARIQIE
jgi:hypothetical protein